VGIVRTVEWRLVCTPEEADQRFRSAFEKLDLSPEGPPGHIAGHAKRSMLKNRWAADVTVDVAPLGRGSMAVCKVDMAGSKHFAVLADVAEGVGDDAFDDRGVGPAVERLGKASRLYGRKEVRHLRNILRGSESVLELGQGHYGGKQGLVVLTDERIFFFEKSLGSETVEEFPLTVINSLSVGKKLTGERLTIYASGNQSEISSMMHGQADAIVRAFKGAKQAQAAPAPAAAASDDPFTQVERLGELRDKGLISAEEFETKKAEILGRL
jgi:PH (Pleckstrin Homology) domain-containing protein/putative oligomerization/nucleic acid binding protein